MTLKQLKAHIKMELEFQETDWETVKRWIERAQFIDDNEGYGYEPKEKAE